MTRVRTWTNGLIIEDAAQEQINRVAAMPFIYKHVAIMPDVHWGCGATIGSVIPTLGAIIPAAVGVDLGCGMSARRTNLTASDLPDNLFNIRCAIEAAVPHGRTNDGKAGDKGAWSEESLRLAPVFRSDVFNLLNRLDAIVHKHPALEKASQRSMYHIGTLGGGNHFIEICLDEEQRVWVMLHSGSRGIGNKIGTYFIELAKREMRRWFINLPDVDLAYLSDGSPYFEDYCIAVKWAQEYAALNREHMMAATLKALQSGVDKSIITDTEAISCHHNYVSWERHFGETVMITRKGAVSAREGELGIIPGSMGAKSFIVRGKGNRDSFHSCSHGAGRVMSRNEAKRRFTVDDQIAATQGVECRKDESVIDEIPQAYKDIDVVMAAQADLVDIVHTLKQLICVKG